MGTPVEKVIVRTYPPPPCTQGHRVLLPLFLPSPVGGQRRRFFLLTVIFHRGQRRRSPLKRNPFRPGFGRRRRVVTPALQNCHFPPHPPPFYSPNPNAINQPGRKFDTLVAFVHGTTRNKEEYSRNNARFPSPDYANAPLLKEKERSVYLSVSCNWFSSNLIFHSPFFLFFFRSFQVFFLEDWNERGGLVGISRKRIFVCFVAKDRNLSDEFTMSICDVIRGL